MHRSNSKILFAPAYCIYIYISCQGAYHRTCIYTVCIFLLCSGDEGADDATHQLILLYVITGWPPWPRMKAFAMFAEPLVAFARALFSLRSYFDATASKEGAAGGTDYACEVSVGAAAIELLRLGCGTSLITVLMSSAYSSSSSVPSQRSAHAWFEQAQQLFYDCPIFRSSLQQLELLSGQRSLVPQLTQLGLYAEQGRSVRRETARVALQTRADLPICSPWTFRENHSPNIIYTVNRRNQPTAMDLYFLDWVRTRYKTEPEAHTKSAHTVL